MRRFCDRSVWIVIGFLVVSLWKASPVLAQSLGEWPFFITDGPLTHDQAGRIQKSATVYLIFWDPDNTMSDAYRAIITRFVEDLPGTDYFNIATQYYDAWDPADPNVLQLGSRHYATTITLGGTYHDTDTPLDAYDSNHRGTVDYPLWGNHEEWDLDQTNDIAEEVRHVAAINSWPTTWPDNDGVQYIVYTGTGVEACFGLSCTPGLGFSGGFCAIHTFSYDSSTSENLVYSFVPYQATPAWGNSCTPSSTDAVEYWSNGGGQGASITHTTGAVSFPNDRGADLAIFSSSHELSETLVYPYAGGWADYSSVDAIYGEMADKCEWTFTQDSDGGNVTLNGHRYFVNPLWSNAHWVAPAFPPDNSDSSVWSAYLQDQFQAHTNACRVAYTVDTQVALTGDTSVLPGSDLTYTLTVVNNGPDPAHGVTIADALPAHTTFVSLTPNTGPTPVTVSTPAAGTAGTVTIGLDPLESGASASFTLVVHVDGAPLDATEIRDTATVSQSAADAYSANNTATVVTTVPLVFAFTGFFAPVDNAPVLNTMKAGSAVPVKFSLGGNQGLAIFAAGSPASQPIACDSGNATAVVEETLTAGGSALTYDATTDQYKYVWKTDQAWKGTCRQLTLAFTDGTTTYALFKFQ